MTPYLCYCFDLGDFKCAIKEEVTLTSGEWEVLARHGSKVRGRISKLVKENSSQGFNFSSVLFLTFKKRKWVHYVMAELLCINHLFFLATFRL